MQPQVLVPRRAYQGLRFCFVGYEGAEGFDQGLALRTGRQSARTVPAAR